MTDEPKDADRPRGILSTADRRFLRGEKEYKHRQSLLKRRETIRERVTNGLRDFRLLADELNAPERERIFAAAEKPRTDELRELSQDVLKAIEFLYAGMRGEPQFRKPLEYGVANGELDLGRVDHALEANPRFILDPVYPEDKRAVAKAIEDEEWGRLDSPSALLSFVKIARRRGAIDFDAVHEGLDLENSAMEAARQFNDNDENDDSD